MPRDGNGNFTRTNGNFSGSTTWQQQAASADDVIRDTQFDTHDQDIADALTGSVARDGQGGMTANLNLGSNRIVSLADAVNDSDAATLADVKNTAGDATNINYTDSGTGADQTTLQDVLESWVFAKQSFGLVGDGVADDTANLKEAMEAAQARGVGVLLMPGTYGISDRIPFICPMIGLGETNTVKIKALGSFLAANSKSFDASADVNPTTDQINIASHGFSSKQPVVYDAAGGTVISGSMSDGGVYWINRVDDNNVRLAATEADSESGPFINLTAGTGTQSLTLKRMMLDFNDVLNASVGSRKWIENISWSMTNLSGLYGWSSTTEGGAGGSSSGYYRHCFFGDTPIDAHAIYADSATSEPGMLTGAVFDNLSIRGEQIIWLGNGMDDIVFNAPRFFPDGNDQGSETDPVIHLQCQNAQFNSLYVGAIGPIGYTVSGSSDWHPVIRVQGASSVIKINGMYAESIGRSSDMTHLFQGNLGFNLQVSDLRVNFDNTLNTARAVVLHRTISSNLRSNLRVSNVTSGEGVGAGNAFKRILETDRGNSTTAEANGVSVFGDGLEDGKFHGFPFTCVKTAGSNLAAQFMIDWHGVKDRQRYDLGFNEGNTDLANGTPVYTGTFDATAVNTTNDTLPATQHEFQTGDAIRYDVNGGGLVGGLTDLATYFVEVVDDDNVALATSQANAFAGTRVDLTSAGTGTQNLERRFRTELVRDPITITN